MKFLVEIPEDEIPLSIRDRKKEFVKTFKTVFRKDLGLYDEDKLTVRIKNQKPKVKL